MTMALIVSACTGGDPSVVSATSTTDVQAATPIESDGTTTMPDDQHPPSTMTTSQAGERADISCWSSAAAPGTPSITFDDLTEIYGLVDPLTGMRAHAAAWGDTNGDGEPDLFVGTFATSRGDVYTVRGADGPSPDRLLLGTDGYYTTATGFPEEFGRSSGAVFADLDNDGDDDLVVSRNVSERDGGSAVTTVMENTGNGFAAAEPTIDPDLGGRSVGVLDVDSDGLLDLLIVEDRYRGGSSRLYRNLGGLSFEDVTNSLFVSGVHGLGVATGDLNNDRHTDVFVAGSNRLFVGTGTGLAEVDSAGLQWETFGNEDDVAGAAIADVNRDGWLDLVVGHHYNSTLSRGVEVPVRLYLNRTDDIGEPPALEDITAAAELTGIPTKAPHVEIADFDNDGWPDILTSASAESGSRPAIFHHDGLVDGIPQFSEPTGLGAAQYWVTAPSADVDRDGRLDVLLVEWEPSLPSLMLGNTTASGNWIEVSVDTSLGGGVGTRVDVYESGGAQDPERLVGSRDIVASLGYTSGVERFAHFGLGDLTEVDVVVTPPLPHEPTVVTIEANQHIRLPDGCA